MVRSVAASVRQDVIPEPRVADTKKLVSAAAPFEADKINQLGPPVRWLFVLFLIVVSQGLDCAP